MMMILLMVVTMMRNSSDDDEFADYLTIPRVVPLEVQNGRLAFKRIMMMARRRMVIGDYADDFDNVLDKHIMICKIRLV